MNFRQECSPVRVPIGDDADNFYRRDNEIVSWMGTGTASIVPSKSRFGPNVSKTDDVFVRGSGTP